MIMRTIIGLSGLGRVAGAINMRDFLGILLNRRLEGANGESGDDGDESRVNIGGRNTILEAECPVDER